jgi:CO/xanthine dehydrogenase Mo-binding subunit
MDFLIPTAMEIPEIITDHVETPSPLNPLGIKGAGEAGVIPVAALMAQALEDALSEWDVRITEMPLTPGQRQKLTRARDALTPRLLSSDTKVRATESGERGR